MNVTITGGERWGSVRIPASKSQMHRLLICAALGKSPTRVSCDGVSRDIAATADCLRAMGAGIGEEAPGVFAVSPLIPREGPALLPCGESGSTLRFLLPVAGALGVEAGFQREGRLPRRPLAPLDSQLTAHGMTIREEGAVLRCSGKLKSGLYTLPGNVSSQYISGLLMALPLVPGDSELRITGEIESAAYITMTEDILRKAGVRFEKRGGSYQIPGSQTFDLPPELTAEGDWSGGAFFLCMGALSARGVSVYGLPADSSQGDRAVLELLRAFGASVDAGPECVTVRRGELRGITVDASPIPDLIPVLSTVAAVSEGETRIVNAARLRLKESDRLETTASMLRALGGQVTVLPDGLVIRGVPGLRGGTVDACGDHRIAMSAAAAACACSGEVTVKGGECTEKSYPRFWEDLERLEENP